MFHRAREQCYPKDGKFNKFEIDWIIIFTIN